MKRSMLICVWILVWVQVCQGEFYYNVDEEMGGPMQLRTLSTSSTYQGNKTYLLTNTSNATNTGPATLTNVGLAYPFFREIYAGHGYGTYVNSDRRWTWAPDAWVTMYGVMGQNDLLSMDPSVTDLPLSYGAGVVQATDSVPVIWLGDLAPGQSVEFMDYVQFYADGWTGGVQLSAPCFFISTIPEPGTMSLLALGGMAILKRRRS